MNDLVTVCKLMLASLMVWRLTRALLESDRHTYPSFLVRSKNENLLAGRAMDCLYWLGVWISGQTAVWVVCGLTGVLVNWVVISGVLRLVQRQTKESYAAEGGVACFAKEDRDGECEM